MLALTRTWAILVLLTLGAMAAGRVTASAALGTAGVALVLLASGLKASQILRNFLELRRAGAGWQAVFYLYLIAVGGVILGAYALARTA